MVELGGLPVPKLVSQLSSNGISKSSPASNKLQDPIRYCSLHQVIIWISRGMFCVFALNSDYLEDMEVWLIRLGCGESLDDTYWKSSWQTEAMCYHLEKFCPWDGEFFEMYSIGSAGFVSGILFVARICWCQPWLLLLIYCAWKSRLPWTKLISPLIRRFGHESHRYRGHNFVVPGSFSWLAALKIYSSLTGIRHVTHLTRFQER